MTKVVTKMFFMKYVETPGNKKSHEKLKQFLLAGCLGLYPSFLRNSLFCSRKSQKKSLKTTIFGVQGHRC